MVAAESEQDQRLAEAAIKRLTGNDTLSARFLFKEFFDFVPSHTLVAGHQLPAPGHGHRRRHLAAAGHDPLAGHRRPRRPGPRSARRSGRRDGRHPVLGGGRRHGLPDGWARGAPVSVVDATTHLYRLEQDMLGDFIAEYCVVGADKWVANADLYKAYADACKNAGESAAMVQQGVHGGNAQARLRAFTL